MYDVYVAEATMESDYQNFNSPEKKEAYINRVFKAHDVTSARWDIFLSWYSDRIDFYLKMNDSVKVRLKRDQVEIEALMAKHSIQKTAHDQSILSDSYIPSYYSFAAPDARRGFRFRLNSNDIVSEITEDQFLFTYSAIGIPPAFTDGISALLSLEYRDTTLYHYQQITENKSYPVSASKYINNDTLMRISGYIQLQKPLEISTHIQLYNVYLGNKETDPEPLMSDTTRSLDPLLEDTSRVDIIPPRIDTTHVSENLENKHSR